MNYLNSDVFTKNMMPSALNDFHAAGPVDFSQTLKIKVDKDLYLEAQKTGLSLSELLELPEYDPSPAGSQLDAFERQLMLLNVNWRIMACEQAVRIRLQLRCSIVRRQR